MRAILVMMILATTASVAAADESVIEIDGALVSPLMKKGTVSDSVGNGAEMRVLFNGDPMTLMVGGFYAIGRPDGDKGQRDVYDFHFDFGYEAKRARGAAFLPFLAVGLDVLNMTSRPAATMTGPTFRGTTIGFNARLGVQGFFAKSWFYTVNATWLGAIVPGTGDDFGSVVLQAGIGIEL